MQNTKPKTTEWKKKINLCAFLRVVVSALCMKIEGICLLMHSANTHKHIRIQYTLEMFVLQGTG